jgi:hypothetical protein
MIFSSFFVIICEVETRKQEINGDLYKKYLVLHEIIAFEITKFTKFENVP